MMILRLAAILLIAVLILFAAWVRLAPTDPAAWHVDPLAAPDPGQGGAVAGPGRVGTYPVAPADLLAAFDAAVMDLPRAQRIAGGVEEGRITYQVRSALWGFPDYLTVQAVQADGGASLAILSRLRFGRSDMGVNEKRLAALLADLKARMAG